PSAAGGGDSAVCPHRVARAHSFTLNRAQAGVGACLLSRQADKCALNQLATASIHGLSTDLPKVLVNSFNMMVWCPGEEKAIASKAARQCSDAAQPLMTTPPLTCMTWPAI